MRQPPQTPRATAAGDTVKPADRSAASNNIGLLQQQDDGEPEVSGPMRPAVEQTEATPQHSTAPNSTTTAEPPSKDPATEGDRSERSQAQQQQHDPTTATSDTAAAAAAADAASPFAAAAASNARQHSASADTWGHQDAAGSWQDQPARQPSSNGPVRHSHTSDAASEPASKDPATELDRIKRKWAQEAAAPAQQRSSPRGRRQSGLGHRATPASPLSAASAAAAAADFGTGQPCSPSTDARRPSAADSWGQHGQSNSSGFSHPHAEHSSGSPMFAAPHRGPASTPAHTHPWAGRAQGDPLGVRGGSTAAAASQAADGPADGWGQQTGSSWDQPAGRERAQDAPLGARGGSTAAAASLAHGPADGWEQQTPARNTHPRAGRAQDDPLAARGGSTAAAAAPAYGPEDGWGQQTGSSWGQPAGQASQQQVPAQAPQAPVAPFRDSSSSTVQPDSPLHSFAPASSEQQAPKPRQQAGDAFVGPRRLVVQHLAAAVADRVAADQARAERRAKMAAARKAAGGAGAAASEADGGVHPPASTAADTAARQRGRQASGVTGDPLQQGAADSAFSSFASGAQRGVNQQPQRSKAFGPGSGLQPGSDARLPTGGRSSQAVPQVNAEDSDDVPPGFEADDMPPGFEQYSRAGLRETSSSTSGTGAPAVGVVADAPPGFEGRALRVQAVLARALQGASSSQLQLPGSARSGHSLPGQPSLRSSAFEGYQERVGQPQGAPAERPVHAEERFSAAGPTAEHVQYSPASAGYRPSRLGAAAGSAAEFPGTPSWQQSAASSGGGPAGSASHRPSTGAPAAAQVLQPRAAARIDSGRGRRYLFVAGPVCRGCGATGHEAADCNTPYCEDCNLPGHHTGCCAGACSTCGWQHAPPLHGGCQRARCNECNMTGHDAGSCPSAQCNRCQCWGHSRDLCPGYCLKCHMAGHTTETCSAPPAAADSRRTGNLGEQQPAATAAEQGQQGAGLPRTAAPTAGPAAGTSSQGLPGSTASAWPEQGRPVRRGTGALAAGRASAAAGTATASGSDLFVGGRAAAGMPADVGAGLSDGSDEYGFVSKGSKGTKAAGSSAAWDSAPSWTAATNAVGSRQPSSAAAGTATAAGCEPGSAVWSSALKQLLSSGGASYKCRAILPPPSGDRVGPYTSAELNGWLLQGLVPKGVGREDARQVAAEPGSLLLCGIADYSAQKLPGAKFYKPLSALVPAVASGLTYSPVTKADLAKGYPTPGWNEGRQGAAAAAAVPAAATAAHTSAARFTPAGAGSSSFGRRTTPTAAEYASDAGDDDAGVPVGFGDDLSSGSDDDYACGFARVRKASKGSKGAAAAREVRNAPPRPAVSAAGARSSAAGAGCAPGSAAWGSALKQLLSGGSSGLKWRTILPSGDRVGPFSTADLTGWLLKGGPAPKGVSREDAREVAADPGSLQLCGIADYSAQKLPGAKFYKPLSALVPAVASGLTYSPVTKADLAKAYPTPGWNAVP